MLPPPRVGGSKVTNVRDSRPRGVHACDVSLPGSGGPSEEERSRYLAVVREKAPTETYPSSDLTHCRHAGLGALVYMRRLDGRGSGSIGWDRLGACVIVWVGFVATWCGWW